CQAEDGIRALYVTGVQTCALPIFALAPAAMAAMDDHRCGRQPIGQLPAGAASLPHRTTLGPESFGRTRTSAKVSAALAIGASHKDRKSVVEAKSVRLGHCREPRTR